MPEPIPDLQLRAAQPADAEAVAAMQALPGFRHGTLRLPYPDIAAVRRFLETTAGDDRALVAQVGDTLAGIADLRAGSGRRRHVGSLGIGVHDDWTGRGIGRALLAALIDHADNWLGLQRLELSVYTDNARALALYRRFGFEIEGTQRAVALRDGYFADAHLMARFHHLALHARE